MRRAAPASLVLALVLASALSLLALAIDTARLGSDVSLGRPEALLLLALPLALAWKRLGTVTEGVPPLWFSQASSLAQLPARGRMRVLWLPDVLRVAALALLCLALARPQTYSEETRAAVGIDLMLVLDVSQSMEEVDLTPRRIDAGKETLQRFLGARDGFGDRVGLVVFAEEAMLLCPLTLDYRSLDAIVGEASIGDVPSLGTAIGDALGLALAQLSTSEKRGKAVVLVSDGDWNTAQVMDPGEARDLSRELGVRVFTVLLGTERVADQPNQYGVNPEILRNLARDTDGRFFRAGSDKELAASFQEIRKELPKAPATVVGRIPGRQFFPLFLWAALGLLALELALRGTLLRRFN